ncbi:hypothetical protein [Arthrobacter oryzae]|uniref:ATP-dependent DNA ligase family profile domain-containing protein n=1 Tax=Arthrobacter oryzae TaxID=409290 RepID=A0A3N0C4L7_9MICC|nr:hypothetical protein [Arthrobacter oryzae]RNL57351.1 hypothetical protein D7003_06945 [Arthrobacter oryzae]
MIGIYLATRGIMQLRQLRPAVVDGEAVVWSGGRLDFEALQRRLIAGKGLRALVRELPASFAGFDVLSVAGHDTRALPLRDVTAHVI